MKCPKCGYDEIEGKKKQSYVIGYDEIADKLNLEGRILYIELREEYEDMIIITKKD